MKQWPATWATTIALQATYWIDEIVGHVAQTAVTKSNPRKHEHQLVDRRVTSLDVARLAGVSQSTVSRALRNDLGMTHLTRMRVMRAAQLLGYVVNTCASSLRRKEATSIFVSVVQRKSDQMDLITERAMRLLPSLCHEIEARGCDMLLSLQTDMRAKQRLSTNVLGMIVVDARAGAEPPMDQGTILPMQDAIVEWKDAEFELLEARSQCPDQLHDLASTLVSDLFAVINESLAPKAVRRLSDFAGLIGDKRQSTVTRERID